MANYVDFKGKWVVVFSEKTQFVRERVETKKDLKDSKYLTYIPQAATNTSPVQS